MPIERFLGRVALLTGATQGIGLATARRLAQEGCKVVLSSRKQENVDEAIETLNKEGLQVSGLVGNQRVREDRKKLLEYTCEKYGGIDCVFMSAGVSPHQGSLLTFGVPVAYSYIFYQGSTLDPLVFQVTSP
ncbi:Dehydrogenase/reductase SDR family member 4 [Apostichopus japonicus]|uniref:Dehydrogenase/reductase SDR family member 4 n=1 Tax=Stichopus japonicus TaxID=307972 RepID=A0A2G8JR96_STIJA|nr:Dehydrogenase/reductase SDR family member 4 [Apostichopus japonicus]